ncbi:DUF4397 domain-containing protein [Bacillus sp. FJAT-47783]|uniref:DUF4397 domain-containing protein n=1 Tax=Bacillus sp. FJAT-47783 TaxID=2922712 RepID=UPI001FAE02E0|nr:DUF4397 domain-containing protein [Bacillus sp. FJAT-47783]
MSFLRILHASPDSRAFNVYINGQLAISGLTFLKMSSYIKIPKGHVRVDFVKVEQRKTICYTKYFFANRSKSNTIACYGTHSNLDFMLIGHVHTLNEDLTECKFVHLSPDAPPFDFQLESVGTIFSNVPYKKLTPYKTVQSQKYDVHLTIAKTKDKVWSQNNLLLRENTSYTFFALGFANGTPSLHVLIAQD